jgi:hypothetical protein
MTTENENLYEQAKKAIDELFSDRSVSQEAAAENLRALRDEIAVLLDSLDV